MPADDYLQFPRSVSNPAPIKKRSREEIRAELARVDAAIDELSGPSPAHFLDGAGARWVSLGSVSLPIALRSLRHYRQRLSWSVGR